MKNKKDEFDKLLKEIEAEKENRELKDKFFKSILDNINNLFKKYFFIWFAFSLFAFYIYNIDIFRNQMDFRTRDMINQIGLVVFILTLAYSIIAMIVSKKLTREAEDEIDKLVLKRIYNIGFFIVIINVLLSLKFIFENFLV